MAQSIDMSLDDLITKNKKHHQPHRRPRRATGGPAPTARRSHPRAAAAAPYHFLTFQAPPAYGYATHPMAMAAAPSTGVETGTKLYISNLDYAVSNEDIKVLFSEVGDLKRHSINYDRSGRSKGTAEVVFSRRSDALAAVKKYNNVQLDGKPMKIEVIGTNIEAPAPLPAATFGFNAPPEYFNFPPKSGPIRGGGRWPRGGGGFGGRSQGRGGRGRGRGGRGNPQISAQDLDADLDKYHSAAMQIS